MRFLLITLSLLVLAAPALAEMVQVEIITEVEYNQVSFGILADVVPGDIVVATFLVDSDNFIDSTSYGVRSYPIDMASFQVTLGTVGPVGLVLPQPDNATVYFVVRESDPVSDGFFLSANPEWPWVNPYLDIPAQLDPYFGYKYEVGYSGDTLSSRDILEAAGSYGYDGIESFYVGLQDAWADAMGCILVQTVITPQGVPVEDTNWGNVKSLYR
jgi:hypothetical protein